jgi:hypothetical protein
MALSTVLLGLRAQFKADLQASAAELVFGDPLRLPGEFLGQSDQVDETAPEFVLTMRQRMADLRPAPASRHTPEKVFIFAELSTCTHVYVRIDRVRRPLEPPYSGPFLVLRRSDKHFTLLVKNKSETVSIDHLKPCYSDSEPAPLAVPPEPTPLPTPRPSASRRVRFADEQPPDNTLRTRSGRCSAPPKRLSFQSPEEAHVALALYRSHTHKHTNIFTLDISFLIIIKSPNTNNPNVTRQILYCCNFYKTNNHS